MEIIARDSFIQPTDAFITYEVKVQSVGATVNQSVEQDNPTGVDTYFNVLKVSIRDGVKC